MISRHTRRSLLRCRCYHTYPDANDKGSITKSISNEKKTIPKHLSADYLKKYQMESPLVGFGTSDDNHTLPKFETVKSKLDSGLTVASQETSGLMQSFAFLVHTGRLASDLNDISGVPHMIEVTAFKSTTVNDVELSTYDLGGIVQCMATREHIIYFMDVMREKSEEALQLFAAAILKPKYTEEEILMGREMMSFLQYELPSEMLIRDAIYMAAYKNSPLGLPYYNFSFESNANITKQKLDLFRSQFFRTGNFVLAGSGMSHTEFAAMANKAFSPYLNQDVVSDEAKKPLPLEDSVYVGGLYTETREMKEPFVKLAVAFEVGGWHSADLVTACVLQMFLGGGSSFSAGGPGKGMYSKLYTDVLNRYHWIESAQSFISVQNKVGLLGIDGSCEPADVQGLFRVLVDQLLQLSIHLIKPIELSRAKNMLKSSLMMQLESRIITCEDIAKQIGTYGIRESPESLCQKIDIVTAEDIRALVGKMTKNDVSVACMGSDTSQMPSYDVINEFTKRYKNELYKKYNFYPKDWS